MERVEGWILDVYPGKDGEMVAWIKTDGDGAIRLTDSWRNAIYVSCSASEGLSELAEWAEHQYMVHSCEYVLKRVKVFEYIKRQVLKLTLRNADQAEKLAKEIEQLDSPYRFVIFNADLMPAQAYFFEKDLFPLARVRAEQAGGHIRWELLDSVMSEDYSIPELKKASIKVRVNSLGRIPKASDPIDTITVKADREIEISKGTERDKILSLVDAIAQVDPDIIFVEKGDDFTTHYLAERAYRNGISDKLILSRNREPIRRLAKRGTSYVAYGRVLHTPTSHRLYGRINLDAENYFVFSECGLDGLFEIARLCRMPLHKGSRASIGKCLSSLQGYIAYKDDLLIPWKPSKAEIHKTAKTLLSGDRGGFIYEPKIGLHESVGEIDFTSLFPFIMTHYNISAETVLCWCCPDSSTRVPDVGYHICQEQVGVIPRSLEPILAKRVSYKLKKKIEEDPELRKVYTSRVDALKGILVTSFGYLSYRNAKFGLIDCHIAVCAYARRILLETTRIAESRGFEVVHGIVDSLWVKKQGATRKDFEGLRSEVQNRIGLPVTFEGIYRWIAFLPSRVHEDVPVLNRYFGIFEDGSMKVRGIELRRRDSIKVVTDCQEELLRLLSRGKDLEETKTLMQEAIQVVKKYVEMVRSGDLPIVDLVILNALSKDYDQYNRNLVHVSAIRQLAEEGLELMAGQSVSYIITDYGSRIQNERVKPIELLDSSTTYDKERYTEILLKGAASILQPFGIDELVLKESIALEGSQTQLSSILSPAEERPR